MFSPEEHESIREALLSMAVADKRMTGAALTGSGALGHEERGLTLILPSVLQTRPT